MKLSRIILLAALFLPLYSASAQSTAIGIFDNHADVGAVKNKGAVEFDAAAKSYPVTGGGENVWAGGNRGSVARLSR